jgi:hypothetical protein
VALAIVKMPNRDLPRLVGGKEGFQELADHEHDLLAFMQQRVVPETTRLLGLPAFDMKAHVGCSCFDCHTRRTSPIRRRADPRRTIPSA